MNWTVLLRAGNLTRAVDDLNHFTGCQSLELLVDLVGYVTKSQDANWRKAVSVEEII
jgi:hypothetical protein